MMLLMILLFFKSKLFLISWIIWILRNLLSHRPYFHTLFHFIHVFVDVVQLVLFLHLLLTMLTATAIAVTIFHCHLVFV